MTDHKKNAATLAREIVKLRLDMIEGYTADDMLSRHRRDAEFNAILCAYQTDIKRRTPGQPGSAGNPHAPNKPGP